MTNPFAALLALKARLPRSAAERDPRPAPGQGEANAAPLPPPVPKPLTELDLFLREMADVTPLGETAPQRVPRPSPDPSMFKSDPSSDEDREVLRYLNDLLAGNVDFDIKYTDEYQEGHVKGLPPLTVQKLRDGLFPVQDHLDLHGLSLSESQIAIHKFVTQAAALRKRSLLIIHGRGLRSPDGIPVLKINLGNLLLRSPVKRHILAFATALPVDGGPGSSYVLLRRHPPALNRGQ